MTEETIEQRIETDKAFIKKLLEQPDLTPPKSMKYMVLGGNANGVALRYLLLGNKSEAQSWFKQSTTYYIKSQEIKGYEYASVLPIIAQAICTMDQLYAHEIAEKLSNVTIINPANLMMPIHKVNTIINLILEDYEKANKAAMMRKESEHNEKNKVKGTVGGDGESLYGISIKNKELTLEGIVKVLEIFKKRVAQTKDMPICMDAQMYLILAKWRGMDLSIMDIPEKYRAFVPLLAE